MNQRTFAIGLVLLTALGLGLRFYRLSNQSLWTDEISSITTARVPLNEITERSASLNNSPPTYFLLLRWMIGDSNRNIETRSRSLSALLGGASVPVFVGVVFLWRRQRGSALLAGLLLAINPLHLWYAQETRGYASMLFFGLLTLLGYELGRKSGKARWWALYGGAGLAAMALHKTGLVFPAACGLWHGWLILRGEARLKTLAPHLVPLAGAVIVFLLKSYPPTKEYGRPSSVLEIAYTFMTFVGGYSFGPSLTEIQTHGAMQAVSRHLIQVVMLAAVLALLGVGCALRYRLLKSSKETMLLGLGVGVVAVAALLTAFPYNVRYALPGLFGFLALAAALVAEPGRNVFARAGIIGTLLIGLWADGQWFYGAAYRKGDSRAVAQWLVDNQARANSWTVLPDYLSIAIEWYLESQSQTAVRSRLQPAKEPQSTAFPPVPDVLIIGRRHHVRDPDRLIEAYRAAAGSVRTVSSIAGFELYLRERSSAATAEPNSGAPGSVRPQAGGP